MKVLVACEYSGIVRDAFTAKGHYAMSVDLLPSESPGNHYQGNVLDVLYRDKWDLMIGHPPCTYLANSGSRWLHEEVGRWDLMDEAKDFFDVLYSAPIDKICLENPIPHKYGLGKTYDQIIQPWQFGHGETKATCLWLKNLPKLVPTNIVDGRKNRIHRMPPGPNRQKERSKFYKGIAEAMADQWG